MNQQTQYTITELAREFDVTPRAIRFYEDQGLLAPTREGSSGLRRVYSPRDRTRLRLTLRGKRLGFTLSEIRTLLDLYDSPTGTVSQLHFSTRSRRTARCWSGNGRTWTPRSPSSTSTSDKGARCFQQALKSARASRAPHSRKP
jgi:DNA-binding transcriptional MerR regulator